MKRRNYGQYERSSRARTSPAGAPATNAPMRMAQRRARSVIPRYLVGRVATTGFYGRFQPSGPELKFLDTIEPNTAVATAGTVSTSSFNIIPQDDTESGRVGRKVNIKKIMFKLAINLPATTVAASTTDRMRIMVIQDKQTNGANPTVAQILATPSTIDSFQNLANASRFNVLYDKTHVISSPAGGAPTATPSFGAETVFLKISKKCDIPIEYDATATTGALTTQRSNNLLLVSWTASNLATLQYTARIRYSDI